MPQPTKTWKRSTYCDTQTCVEVAIDGDTVYVRNSNQPNKVVTFTREEWDVFRAGINDGEFAV